VVVDHYSKWCKAKTVVDHGAKTIARFLKDDINYRYGVPKFVLTDNGGKWAVEFDVMFKDYGIVATLALARDQGKGVASVRAYK